MPLSNLSGTPCEILGKGNRYRVRQVGPNPTLGAIGGEHSIEIKDTINSKKQNEMEHDIYYQRQCELIERAQQAEREREMIRRYHREKSSREAYFRLMETKRYKIVRECKTKRSRKKPQATITKCERQVYRTCRFDNSYITVYCKGRATA